MQRMSEQILLDFSDLSSPKGVDRHTAHNVVFAVTGQGGPG